MPVLAALRQLLFSPESFFAVRGRDELLRGVIPVVLLVGLISVLGYLAIGWVFARHSAVTVDQISGTFLPRVPMVLVATLVGWLLFAVGLHVTSALAGGEGSFLATLVVTGWGMLPSVVQTVAAVLALSITLQGEQFARDPSAFANQVQGLTGAGLGPVFVGGALVAAMWQGYVWAGGLQQMRDLERSRALVAAGMVATVLFLSAIA